jgi:hypothetical protein
MGDGEGGLCGPMVHVPFGGGTEGARQSLCPARHQGGSSRLAILLVAERIVCAVVAAPTATPMSGDSCVREDRPQVRLSSSNGGQLDELDVGMKHGLELGECVLGLPPRRKARLPWGQPPQGGSPPWGAACQGGSPQGPQPGVCQWQREVW